MDRAGSDRRGRVTRYLMGLDRGECVSARVMRFAPPDGVVVEMGPGAVWARAIGGRPGLGACRFEVVAPGRTPTLRLLDEPTPRRLDLVVDPSREKAQTRRGRRLDHRA